MRKRFGILVAALGLGLAAASTAEAGTLIDFDAQGYVNSELVEGSTLGVVTLTSELGDLRYSTIDLGGLWGNSAASADVFLSFSSPVSNVSFTAGDSGFDDDAFRVELFAFGTDAPLGTFDTPLFNTTGDPDLYTLTLPVANVGRAVFDPGNSGALPGSSSLIGGVFLKSIEFDAAPVQSVPLPGAALSGIALLGLLGISRLRKRP